MLGSDDDVALPDYTFKSIGDSSEEDSAYPAEEQQIFNLEQLQWEPSKTEGKLIAIDVAEDTIIVATNHRCIILLKTNGQKRTLLIKDSRDPIHRLFIDPKANHLLVTMKNGLNYYFKLQSSNNRPTAQLSKLKGITIESVVWSRRSSVSRTGTCLIGTSNGCIYSIEINEGKEKHFHKLYDLKTNTFGNNSNSNMSADDSNSFHSDNVCFRVCGLHVEYLSSPKEMHKTDYKENDAQSKKKRKKQNENQKNQRFYILAVIPSKIYEFIGGPTFDDVFRLYDKSPLMHEISVDGNLNHTRLCAYNPHGSMSECIGWLTEAGIVMCKCVFGSHVTSKTGIIGDQIHENIIRYGGNIDEDWHGMTSSIIPIAFTITKFHILLIYKDCFLAINRLSRRCVEYQSIPIGISGEAQDIAIYGKYIYVLCSQHILQLQAIDEERDIWRLYLNENKFELALRYAKNIKHKAQILRNEAEYYFENERFIDSALKYAQLSDISKQYQSNLVSQSVNDESNVDIFDYNHNNHGQNQIDSDLWINISFEEITLKFLNKNATNALMVFLVEKLNRMHTEDKTQRTILVTWITEMHLSKINECSACNNNEDEQRAIDDFEEFFKLYRDILSTCKHVIFDLISSHGRIEQLIEFARIQHDWNWVLNYYIQNEQYMNAIRVLGSLSHPAKYEELYYTFAPILMYVYPEKMIDMLIKVQGLDPKLLIPALMRYEFIDGKNDDNLVVNENISENTNIASFINADRNRNGMDFSFIDENKDDGEEKANRNIFGDDDEVKSDGLESMMSLSETHANQAIRYLEHCISKGSEKSRDPSIHNYLISLYCNQRKEDGLLHFIQSQIPSPIFDIKYALRLCHQENKIRSCIELYKIMKLFEDAIHLALLIPTSNYKLAKNIAHEFSQQFTKLPVSKDEAAQTTNEIKRLWLLIAKYVVQNVSAKNITPVLDIINESEGILSIEDILPYLEDFTEIGPFKKDIKSSLQKYTVEIEKLKYEMSTYTKNAEAIRSDTKQLYTRSTRINSDRKCDLSGLPVLNMQLVLFACGHTFRSDALYARVEQYFQQIGKIVSQKQMMEFAISECALCGVMMIDEVMRPFIDMDDENDRREVESWDVGGEDSFYSGSVSSAGKGSGERFVDGRNTDGKNKLFENTISLDDINISELNIGGNVNARSKKNTNNPFDRL